MSTFDLMAALALPDGALVDRRVPKMLLVENGAPTARDKRRIREEVDELRWLAALKPTTVGVAAYGDPEREYREIAVLQLTLRPGARVGRITELVHRAVPYPVLLATRQAHGPQLSLAHKRWSRGETGKTVLDGALIAVELGNTAAVDAEIAFRDALAVPRQPRASLHALYQGWMDALLALRVAAVTGVFLVPGPPEAATGRAAASLEYERLKCRIAELSAEGSKERQVRRLAELNLELNRLRTDLAAVRARL
ncbi:MAG: DUF4391 domain-containing protein [Spirochaetaceae bacterium]|nr:DUF4391 domain-containing protein [Spirochaetaceae bacterium]